MAVAVAAIPVVPAVPAVPVKPAVDLYILATAKSRNHVSAAHKRPAVNRGGEHGAGLSRWWVKKTKTKNKAMTSQKKSSGSKIRCSAAMCISLRSNVQTRSSVRERDQRRSTCKVVSEAVFLLKQEVTQPHKDASLSLSLSSSDIVS